MTRVAGESSRMIRCRHLRKAPWFGAVGFMTPGADDGCVQIPRLHGTGVVRVLGLGAVAGLARDHHMLAQLLLIHDVGMAGLAGAVPGKRNWPGRDLGNRRASIVAILAKAARYDRGPQHYECCQRNCHDHGQSDQVFDVLKQVAFPVPDCPARSARENAQCAWIPRIRLGSDDRSHVKL